MDEKLAKLQKLLRELFQLDEPDLDFGLYRIMHAKAGEVQKFLDQGLPDAVSKAFGKYQSADKTSILREIEAAAKAAQAAGFDPEQSPKVK
jgi:adenine-specific DNA-methyltransferase